MNFEDRHKFGLYILVINIILTLFLLSSDKSIIYFIVTIVSNVVAIVLNIMILSKSKKKLLNIIALIINIIIPALLITLKVIGKI